MILSESIYIYIIFFVGFMLDCWVLAVLANIRRSNLYKSDRFDLASRQLENPCELGQVHENFTYESNSFVINRGTVGFLMILNFRKGQLNSD